MSPETWTTLSVAPYSDDTDSMPEFPAPVAGVPIDLTIPPPVAADPPPEDEGTTSA